MTMLFYNSETVFKREIRWYFLLEKIGRNSYEDISM